MGLRSLLPSISALFLLAAGATAASTPDDRARVWLAAHNDARAAFGSSPLRWSDRLADEAGSWARELAGTGQMRHASHSERRGRGENLWMGTRAYFPPGQMVASFLDEQRHFVPGAFPQVSRTGRWSDVGHYTQIVWPETREVGCALAQGRDVDVLVCRYWPAGNVIGTYLAPVPGRLAVR
jgi:hypothetical protein